jgi:hypothetical protein
MIGTLIEAFAVAGETIPDARLIVMSGERPADTSLSNVIAAGRRLGTRMMAAGVMPGDVVAVMLPNWREWLEGRSWPPLYDRPLSLFFNKTGRSGPLSNCDVHELLLFLIPGGQWLSSRSSDGLVSLESEPS